FTPCSRMAVSNENLLTLARVAFRRFGGLSLRDIGCGRHHILDVQAQELYSVGSPMLTLINPGFEISCPPILLEGVMSGCPPELRRQRNIIMDFVAANKTAGSGLNHAIVGAGGDGHLCCRLAHDRF